MEEGSAAAPTGLRLRVAGRSDAAEIAALHADSWRRHYRGAYSDAFLDGDVQADRHAVWTEQVWARDSRYHTIFDEDPTWGALLDNLHVAHGQKRRGVGRQLMRLTARAVVERGTGLYLWVLEQNVDGQSFYEALGAKRLEEAPVTPPGGVAGRLRGSPLKLRYAWADPAILLD
jgi:ribosomal protein S18 acetylase RimI-like enzyme